MKILVTISIGMIGCESADQFDGEGREVFGMDNNLLEAARRSAIEAVFIILSANRFCGAAPNEVPMKEASTAGITPARRIITAPASTAGVTRRCFGADGGVAADGYPAPKTRAD